MGAVNRRKALPLVPIACAAAAVRALALWDDGDSLLYRTGGLDAPQYLEMARGFVHGRWPADEPFFWAPGYPLFLGLLALVSEHALWLKAVQIALGAASCALVTRVAARVFDDRRVTLLSGGIAALYGPLVYYDLQASPASLDVFSSLLLLVLLLHAHGSGRVWPWLAAGVVAAASAITRGAVLLFLPLVLIGLMREAAPARARLLAACALLAPVLVALALVGAHNWRHDRGAATDTAARAPIPISYNVGINLWIGNVPELYAANHVEHRLCFLDYKEAIFEPVLHGIRRPSAQSAYLTQKTGRWILDHPAAWLGMLATKLGELVQGSEISRDTSIEASRLDNHVLAWLIWRRGLAFPSGLLIPLALVGIAFAPRRSVAQRLLLAALASQALFVLTFFVTTRYRLVLWTMAIPYAAWALVHAAHAAKTWTRPVVFFAGALALLLLALSNRDQRPMPSRHAAFEYEHLGHVLDREGKHDEAARQWQTAVALDPSYASAHFQLALYYTRRHDAQRAESHYVAGLQAAPDTYAARFEYAKLLVSQARTQEAADQTRRVLARLPPSAFRQTVCAFAKRSRLAGLPECG